VGQVSKLKIGWGETEFMSYTVFYLNPGVTEEVAAIIHGQMPAGWRLTTPAPGGDFTAGLRECDFILVADHAVTAEHIAAARGLRMIQHQGVGYERIDLEACRARGIPVALTPEGTSIGVAEHTLLLILAVYKQLVKAATGARAGKWMQWELRGNSFELYGKTLGLVGMGRIGREVAERASAFGAGVIYYDPFVSQLEDPPVHKPIRRMDALDEFLAAADIVSLHVPASGANRHFINAETLGKMKPGALLINTSRGALVDEAALVEALRAGRLAGAGLDVLEKEPATLDNPLLHFENVVITPHIAAGTRDALATKMRAAFANLQRFTRGESLHNVVPELAEFVAPPSGGTARRGKNSG
jgi:phosphoglycerate dehydrogenase-like enzyme